MKAYYYFLYRIYWFYKDIKKQRSGQAIFSVVAVSTLFIVINMLTIFFLANYFDLVPFLKNTYDVIPFMSIVGGLNYYFFIRKKKFFICGFKKDKKGGFLVVAYMVLTFLFAFIIGKFNREKIFSERGYVKLREINKQYDPKDTGMIINGYYAIIK